MECLSSFCSCIQHFVTRQDLSNVFYTKEKLDDLENAMKDLMAMKSDVQRELDDPQHRGKLLSDELQRWLLMVREKDDNLKRLLDEYSKGSCVAGSCSLNCFSRYKISRIAIRLKKEIAEFTTKQPEIKFAPPPKPVPESYTIVGKMIGSNIAIARSYLTDTTTGVVGIWGMGGVGKTTLLKKIRQLLLDDATMGFDYVLFIEASQNTQLEELQKKIAEKLRLAPDAGQDDILEALQRKNFVLLLDNIWEEVDLVGLGILNPYSDNNSTKQCRHKVIFTTRSEGVCARMGAGEKKINVECLEPDDAWDLFKVNVNLDAIESDKKFKKIAVKVMNKCGGLPLALKVVGKAMSNRKNVQDWESTLNSLKHSSSYTEVVQGMQESLFPILKFSYDNLPRKVQECFLRASMLRDSSKEEVLECWMGLGLIGGDFVNLQQVYGQARRIFNTLKESCLLSFDDGGDHVYFHDVIYEMAMWIASDCGRNRNKLIVKSYGKEIPTEDAENWRFANQVIISGFQLELLPILSHLCSDLLGLMIRNGFSLKKLPEGFFRQMPNLIYLDLSFSCIEELPKDIKCLVNLQCLNISYTSISTLSESLVCLRKLQYLKCRKTWLRMVHDGLLSRLQELKVIDIYPSGLVAPAELQILKKHIKAIGMCVVSQEVFQQLSCLPTTRLCIESLDELASLSFDTLSCKDNGYLEKLKIVSCPELEKLVMKGNATHLKVLKIVNVQKLQNIIWKDVSPPEFFQMLKTLFISNCSLPSFAWVLHLPCLSYLTIEDCSEIETLFYLDEEEREIQQVSEHFPAFPALKSLHLIKLPKLVSISNVALDFPQLSLVAMLDCAEIETLFYLDEEEREIQPVAEHLLTFPALQDLVLRRLPKLVSVTNVAWDFPQLSRLFVGECANLKELPFKRGINNSQRIIEIHCEREWWGSLEWDDATILSHLDPFFHEVGMREPV